MVVETLDKTYTEEQIVELSGEEYEALSYYYDNVAEKMRQELLMMDPVAKSCKYRYFISYSEGKDRPKRKRPKEVELLGYGGRFYQIRDGRGPFDNFATEVLGDSVPTEEVEKEFLKRVRQLPYS